MLGMKKTIPAKLTALGVLGTLIAVMAFAGGCGTEREKTGKTEENISTDIEKKNSAGDEVVFIDSDPISTEEYMLMIEKHKNDILMKYSTDQVNQPGFWEKVTDGITPAEQLEAVIQDELQDNYAVKHLAMEYHLTDDYTFEDLKKHMNMENTSQENSESVEPHYGLATYNLDSYYNYWYSNLETQLMNQLTSDEKVISVSDAKCRTYYEEQQSDFTYDTGVDIIYVEASENDDPNAEQTVQDIVQDLQSTNDVKKLAETYPQINIQELELNSLNTQEGMNGVYLNRWELASTMEQGQIYGPYEDQGAYCAIKCLKRTESGVVEYDMVKDQIRRYLQTQEVQKLIQNNKDNQTVKEGTVSAKELIVQTFQNH